jgi:hypothetical protein
MEVSRVEKEVKVNIPIEEVFSYLSEPSNVPEIWPSLIEIKDVQSLSNGGYRFGWTYKVK